MADRDDGYRGYGRPSGRYYEGREYGRDDRGGRGRDEWRGRERDEDRGFFERAGEEIRSWFGDDDDRGERGSTRGGWEGGRHDRDRGQGYGGGDRDVRRDAGATFGGGRAGSGGGYDSGGSRYGATSGYGAGSSRNQFSGGGRHPHDDHYQEWRNQQLSELDRDYDEYRRENRDKFHSEFTSWRGQRHQQRQNMRQAREHMDVIGSDGQPVGTVDKVSGDRIILTKNGPMAGGHHHSIPCSWIQSVDDKVTINKTAEQARQQWTDEENRRALFEDKDQGEDGPHILDRSFSGTYDR